MAWTAAVCNGHKILQPPAPKDHSSDMLWSTRSNGMDVITRTRPEIPRLFMRMIKLLAVFLCRRNFLRSTKIMNMFAVTLTTKIRMYMTRLKSWRCFWMVADSVGGGFVVEIAIVNLDHLKQTKPLIRITRALPRSVVIFHSLLDLAAYFRFFSPPTRIAVFKNFLTIQRWRIYGRDQALPPHPGIGGASCTAKTVFVGRRAAFPSPPPSLLYTIHFVSRSVSSSMAR